MSTPRIGHGYDFDGNGHIFVFGGWQNVLTYAPLIERYSTKNDEWDIISLNVIGTNIFDGHSRQCMSISYYPNHGTVCIEYPNGQISVVQHEENLAMSTMYKMDSYLGMVMDDTDAFGSNYSLFLMLGTAKNPMLSLIDKRDGSMDCCLEKNELISEPKTDYDSYWILWSIAWLLCILFFVCLLAICLWKKWKKRRRFGQFKRVQQEKSCGLE